MSYLEGDVDDAWADAVHAAGGVATVWPSNANVTPTSFAGLRAARYPASTYTGLRGRDPNADPSQPPSTYNGYTYVLATPAVVADYNAVTGQSIWQELENSVFTSGDTAADAIGLPDLSSIEGELTTAAWIAGGALVAFFFGPTIVAALKGKST